MALKCIINIKPMNALVGWSRGAGLTSVGHHDLFDWSILATLGGGVGGAGEQTCPPYGQEAQAAAHSTAPQHAGRTTQVQLAMGNEDGERHFAQYLSLLVVMSHYKI